MLKNLQPKMKTISGDWLRELVESVGQYIRVETLDGTPREGRLSRIINRDLLWNGKKVLIPVELELNGDPQDLIPLDRLARLKLVEIDND